MTSIVEPVVYAVYVNQQLQKENPVDVELRQAWGQHDLFYIRIEYRKQLTLSNKVLWPDNAPVRIIWGQSPSNMQVWYGYINHYTIDGNADSGSNLMQITYTCIGTSKPMNTDRTRTWGQVSGTYIAKKIAGEHSLRCVLTSSDWVLSSEVQANESDFMFLNRIADKIGYRFWVSGGTLYFIDPAVILQNGGSQNVPQFYMDKSYLYLDTLRDFHMLKGDNIPGAVQAARTIFGIDSTTGAPFSITASNSSVPSSVTQTTSEWPVTSYSEAQHLVNAWQSRSQFWLAATAELYGNSYIYPGKLIYLRGNQLNAEATGYWIVASACQVMKSSGTSDPTKDRYVTRVELLKNTTATALLSKNTTKVSPEFISCNLLNGIWRSVTQSIIYENGTI